MEVSASLVVIFLRIKSENHTAMFSGVLLSPVVHAKIILSNFLLIKKEKDTNFTNGTFEMVFGQLPFFC